jgi:hypothetical protein
MKLNNTFKYPIINKKVQITLSKEITRISGENIKPFNINNDAARFLTAINGISAIPEILENVLKKKPLPEEIANMEGFFDQLVQKGIVSFQTDPQKMEIETKGNFDKIL